MTSWATGVDGGVRQMFKSGGGTATLSSQLSVQDGPPIGTAAPLPMGDCTDTNRRLAVFLAMLLRGILEG